MEKSHPFSENGNRLPSPPPDTQTGAKLVDNVGGAENDSIQIIFLGDLPAELQCKKCGQILRFPQKLDCGHRFCASCIAGLHTCPQCSALIDSSKLKLDKESQRRIQRLAVQCTFHDNGCPWKGELRELEAHALTCENADVVCPRGCGMVFPKSEEVKHLEEECPKKTQACPHCDKSVTVKGLKTHLKVCPLLIIDCPNGCGFKRARSEMTDHLPECPKAGSCCPFGEFGCQYTGGRENLQKHIKESPVKHLSLLCDGVLDLKVLLATVQLNAEKLSRNVDLLTTKIRSVEKLYGAQFIWRLSEFTKKRKNPSTIFSPPFLSGRHGYKLVMSVGFATTEGGEDYLSIFIAIMAGDYDAILPWPFVHKVTFTMMDQNSEFEKRKHLSYTVKPYASVENKAILDRPLSEKNASFGAKHFCDMKSLKQYIKDDTLFIKCNIDTENMIVL